MNFRKISDQNDHALSWYVIGIFPGIWAIIGSRWGSYLPREPFFLSDFLILVLILSTATSARERNRKKSFSLYSVFAWFLLLQLTLSNWTEPLIVLRDFIPYFYILISPLITLRMLNAPDKIMHKICLILEWSLTFHAVWTLISFFFPSFISALPVTSASQNINLFSIRPDFDALLISVFIALVILKKIHVIGSRMKYLIAFFGFIFIAMQNNRASFISLTFLVLLSIRIRLSQQARADRRLIFRIFILSLAAILVFVISQISIGHKFLGTFKFYSQESAYMTGAGTASARLEAWKMVIRYTNSSERNILLGVGFGTDYLQDSGALRALVNSTEGSRTKPRQPHNYWLNSYARMGIIGTSIICLIFYRGIRIAFKTLNNLSAHLDVNVMASLIIIGLIPIASLGVVLESPFGALAASLSLGILLRDHYKAY